MEHADQEDIRAALDSLLATVAGLTVAIGALIQTLPRHAQMQLAMTALLEQQLGSGALSTVLNEPTATNTVDVEPQHSLGSTAAS